MKRKFLLNRVFFLFLLMNLFFCTAKLFAQESALTIDVSVVSGAGNGDDKFTVTVNVEGANPAYTFKLYDKEPWKGGVQLDTSENVHETEFSFFNISAGDYLVCVIDSKDNTSCKKISVSAN